MVLRPVLGTTESSTECRRSDRCRWWWNAFPLLSGLTGLP